MKDTHATGDSPASASTRDDDDVHPRPGLKDPSSSGASGGKRKKANRACFHCQKAHLTCDDARPCGRCVKRGLGESCADGVRKKAKYLRDYESALLQQARSTPGQGSPPPTGTAVSNGETPQTVGSNRPNEPQFAYSTETPSNGPLLSYDSTLTPALNPSAPTLESSGSVGEMDLNNLFASGDFGSLTAGSEYAILSRMLGGNGFNIDSPLSFGDGATGNMADGAPQEDFAREMARRGTLDGTDGFDFGSRPSGSGTGNHQASSFLQLDGIQGASTPVSMGGGSSGPAQTSAAVSAALANGFSNLAPLQSTSQIAPLGSTSTSAPGQTQPVYPSAMPTSHPISGTTATATATAAGKRKAKTVGGELSPDEVYRNVTKPYRYTDSYHFLIRHLKERFEKNDILRVVRALAIYRPSLIALQMPLTEEDEIFVEKCFQRTLIEFDKLISFSGTPTVVWRRTGEISCVGTEFCLLTEWTRDMLLGRKKFIYELFDTSSTVEYYEAFATHAFENTTQAVMTTCVLLTPKGRPVPCTCCFTIKRDLFNCPSLVIGSFLPILGG